MIDYSQWSREAGLFGDMDPSELSMRNLSTVRPGSSVRVLRLEGRPDVCSRLREMGFCENSIVRCVQAGSACICQIQHSRVGLSSQLASHIVVEPVA